MIDPGINCLTELAMEPLRHECLMDNNRCKAWISIPPLTVNDDHFYTHGPSADYHLLDDYRLSTRSEAETRFGLWPWPYYLALIERWLALRVLAPDSAIEEDTFQLL